MSKQVIVDYIPFEVSPQQINESMKDNNGRLVVKVYYKEQKLKIKTEEFIQKKL